VVATIGDSEKPLSLTRVGSASGGGLPARPRRIKTGSAPPFPAGAAGFQVQAFGRAPTAL